MCKNPVGPAQPISLYTMEEEGITRLSQWPCGVPREDGTVAQEPWIIQEQPVVSSPTHLECNLDGRVQQYIILKDDQGVVYMDFKLPERAYFMKPNMDTMLLCHGIRRLLRGGVEVRTAIDVGAIDVGAGSGFVAKYLAQTCRDCTVTALDIDPKAALYMRSPAAGMPRNVCILMGDAVTHLSEHAGQYDLVVSNPPYVPTRDETQFSDALPVQKLSFWEGTHLMCHLLEEVLPSLPTGGHLVLVISSISLKSLRLFTLLQKSLTQVQVQVLHRKEVVYRAGILGDYQVDHLLATDEERKRPLSFSAGLKLFVGITPPGSPREPPVKDDGRTAYKRYYWQMIYVIDFIRLPAPTLPCPQEERSRAQPIPEHTQVTTSMATQGGLTCGPEAWSKLGERGGFIVKILDAPLPEPSEKVQEGRVRLYIPDKISLDGRETCLTPNTLLKIGRDLFNTTACDACVLEESGNYTSPTPQWIEIEQDVTSCGANLDAMREAVAKRGCRIPTLLEAVAANLLLFICTGTRITRSPDIYCLLPEL